MKLSLAVATLVVLTSGSLPAALLVTIVPQTQTVAPGSSTAVQVSVSGFGADTPPSLGDFDFNLTFNPAIVSFTGLTFGDPLLGDQLNLSGLGSISDFGIQSPGVLEFYEISLDPATTLDTMQAGHFVIATLQFQAIGRGTTSLVPSLNSIGDSQGAPLAIGFQTGSINVVAAPEPTSLWLVPFAAAWIAWRGKRGPSVSRA